MKKTILMGLAISLFVVSCKKEVEPTKVEQDSIVVAKDTLSEQMENVVEESIVEEPKLELHTFTYNSKLPSKIRKQQKKQLGWDISTVNEFGGDTEFVYSVAFDERSMQKENIIVWIVSRGALIKVNGEYEALEWVDVDDWKNQRFENEKYKLGISNLTYKNVSQKLARENEYTGASQNPLKGQMRLLDKKTGQQLERQVFVLEYLST